ncbi:MAG: FAD-dependent oxidoreductase [Thiohalomonadales bacterium]
MELSRKKILIIGGGAAGIAVATRLRRLHEAVEVILFESSEEIAYANAGIPYFLGGVIKDEARLRSYSPAQLSSLLNIDIRTQEEVFTIRRATKSVIVRKLCSGEVYEESYHKLVLATGSTANNPDFEQVDATNIFTLRNREEGLAIKHFLANNGCKRALVVGGGMAGLEAVENINRLGFTVTLLEKSEHILNDWDPEMSRLLQRRLWDRKIRVITLDKIMKVEGQDVILQSGKILKADIIILALGVTPNGILANECGLSFGPIGGVSVNGGLLTSDEHIYALGDAIELQSHRFPIRSVLQPLGSIVKQAGIVADNLCGRHNSFNVPQLNMILKVFDLSIAVAGVTETRLIKENINYQKSYSEAQSLAGYYPKTRSMIIKLLFKPNTGTLLGAQIVGGNGVDKRIDVIATAMQMELPADRLKDLNLCFSPPFSNESDPVNVAGRVAANMLDGAYKVLHWEEFVDINLETVTMIDVRSSDEFKLRTVVGAINIPLENLRDRCDEIPRNKLIVVFSYYGKRGYFAHNLLRQLGFPVVYNISGGLTIFQSTILSLSKSSPERIEIHEEAEIPVMSDANTIVDRSSVDKHIPDNHIPDSHVPNNRVPNNRVPNNHSAMVQNNEEIDVVLEVALSPEIDKLGTETTVIESDSQGTVEDLTDSVPVMHSPIYSEASDAADLAEIDLDLEAISKDGIPVLEVEYESLAEKVEEVLLEDGTSYLPQVRAGINYSDVSVLEVDAVGLNCPGPIMKLAKTMSQANEGDIVRITATDTKFGDDLKIWCEKKGHRLLEYKDNPTNILAVLLKC